VTVGTGGGDEGGRDFLLLGIIHGKAFAGMLQCPEVTPARDGVQKSSPDGLTGEIARW